MTKQFSRRAFTKLALAGGTATALAGCAVTGSGTKARVVVVGGGFGGATAAKYLRILDPAIDVTLIEPKRKFVTGPFSNAVIAGLTDIDFVTYGYDALRDKHGVNVIHDSVAWIDAARRRLRLEGGTTLDYDKLILGPGIAFRFDATPGYDEAATIPMPHAWTGGPQTLLLRNQLAAMRDGGTFIVAPPPTPFRGPSAPYERVSLVAYYLNRNKPKSKILILDASPDFPKQVLFMEGWKALYGDMIEWVPPDKGGRAIGVDARSLTVYTELDPHRGDVVNFIPAQKAARIAEETGATDATGWCPVDPVTFESVLLADVHVIGDAAVADPLPKSGYAANSEAKACAAAVAGAITGRPSAAPSFIDASYSLVAPDYGISTAMVYTIEDGRIAKVAGAGGTSPLAAPAQRRAAEARYAMGWYRSITADTWG